MPSRSRSRARRSARPCSGGPRPSWRARCGAILFYFLLASGDLFLTKVIKVVPRLQDKKRAVQIARETEDQFSGYLATTAIINTAFGAVVAGAMWWLGCPIRHSGAL